MQTSVPKLTVQKFANDLAAQLDVRAACASVFLKCDCARHEAEQYSMGSNEEAQQKNEWTRVQATSVQETRKEVEVCKELGRPECLFQTCNDQYDPRPMVVIFCVTLQKPNVAHFVRCHGSQNVSSWAYTQHKE